MYFKPYYLGCLSQASYLIGDGGEAALIDPRRDVEEYLADAAAAGLTIRYVIETHLHADFVSGHQEAARRTGATIYLGEGSGATFPHHAIRDGDALTLGKTRLVFRATPGHTPESVTTLIYPDGADAPALALTGDTLFIGDVGRPDLVGAKGKTPQEMARQLYASLRNVYFPLPDATEIWPAHGAGSSCGKALAEERFSTLGRQKVENPALRLVLDGDEDGFVQYATEGLGVAPAYFGHDAEKNRVGAASVADVLAAARPLTGPEAEELSERGKAVVLDTRPVEAFGAGHIPGAVNVPLEGRFAPSVGTVLPPDAPLIVVAEPGKEEESLTRLTRVGYEKIVGWLDGGMAAWQAAGGEMQRVPQVTPDELRARLQSADPPLVVDVRTPAEREEGHIAGSLSLPLTELPGRIGELPKDKPLVVHCESGYRSGIAASLLQRAGHRAENLTGGWAAYKENR